MTPRDDINVSEKHCRFVVLAYSPSVMQPTGSPCVLVVSFPRKQIEVFRSSAWDALPDEIRQYLSALAHDWVHAPVHETGDLMRRLEELSVPPLRMCKTGESNWKDIQSFLKEFGAGPWKRMR
jgi:hypothetical protein